VVSFTPRPLYPQEESPWYPLARRLGEPQSRSAHGREEEKKVRTGQDVVEKKFPGPPQIDP